MFSLTSAERLPRHLKRHVTVIYVYDTMFGSWILHGSWQIFLFATFQVKLPEEDYQSIIETLQIKIFANYREMSKI